MNRGPESLAPRTSWLWQTTSRSGRRSFSNLDYILNFVNSSQPTGKNIIGFALFGSSVIEVALYNQLN